MERLNVFKCELCGNIVEVMHVGGGTLACCGQPMTQLVEDTTDAATEKHVPVVERTAEGIMVKVGSVAHPMVEEHYIQWIEVIADGRVCRKFLSHQDPPEALFETKAESASARAYCNLHGLWKGA